MASDSLDMELEIAVSCHAHFGNPTAVPRKSSLVLLTVELCVQPLARVSAWTWLHWLYKSFWDAPVPAQPPAVSATSVLCDLLSLYVHTRI